MLGNHAVVSVESFIEETSLSAVHANFKGCFMPDEPLAGVNVLMTNGQDAYTNSPVALIGFYHGCVPLAHPDILQFTPAPDVRGVAGIGYCQRTGNDAERAKRDHFAHT